MIKNTKIQMDTFCSSSASEYLQLCRCCCCFWKFWQHKQTSFDTCRFFFSPKKANVCIFSMTYHFAFHHKIPTDYLKNNLRTHDLTRTFKDTRTYLEFHRSFNWFFSHSWVCLVLGTAGYDKWKLSCYVMGHFKSALLYCCSNNSGFSVCHISDMSQVQTIM